MIIILNGPCGVGKSTLSNRLASLLNRSVHIRADDVHNFITDSEIVPDQILMTDKNIKDLVKNFKSGDYKNIIIDNVYEEKDHIDRVINELGEFDKEIIAIRLYCRLDENIERDRLRKPEDASGHERIKELHEVFGNKSNDVGILFDTTNKSIDTSAEELYCLIEKIKDEKKESLFNSTLREFNVAKAFIPEGIKGMHKINIVGDYPGYFSYGKGANLYDIDNNEYIDYVMGKGPYILGYCDEDVDKTVIEQVKSGNVFPMGHLLHNRLAEKVIELIPCAERVLFYKTGTCATSAAIRLARVFTGKNIVFSSGYHGWQDWCNQGLGVPVEYSKYYYDFGYNLNKLEELVKVYGHDGAAIIITPEEYYFSNEYYKELELICKRNNMIFILDEVKSGFRVDLRGFQHKYDLNPDLSVFSKAISNGYSISVVAGKENILEVSREIHTAGTYDTEVIPFAAALATIEKLENADVLNSIYTTGNYFVQALTKVFYENELNMHVIFAGGSFRFWSGNLDMEKDFYREMARNGILFYAFDNSYISYAHDKAVIDVTIKIVEKVVRDRLVKYKGNYKPFTLSDINTYKNKKGFLANYPSENGRGKYGKA